MGCRSNVFNFVSFIPFVCCLVIYEPNCNCCSEYPLNSGKWRNNCSVTRALGTAHRLKEFGFHQIQHLGGFEYTPALWGGKNCSIWDWRDEHCLGWWGIASTCSSDRQPDQDLFVLDSAGGYVHGSIFEMNLPNTQPWHTCTLVWIPVCFQSVPMFLSHPTKLDVLLQQDWIKASWANIQIVLNDFCALHVSLCSSSPP